MKCQNVCCEECRKLYCVDKIKKNILFESGFIGEKSTIDGYNIFTEILNILSRKDDYIFKRFYTSY